MWNLPWTVEELKAKIAEEHVKAGVQKHEYNHTQPDCPTVNGLSSGNTS